MLSKSYRRRARQHSSFLPTQTELRPDLRTPGVSGLSPHCWNTDCHSLAVQWNFFNDFIVISLGQSPDTLVIQGVISPGSCHSGSSRACWPGPSLSLPKATPAGVLRTEQFCALPQFCTSVSFFNFFFFSFVDWCYIYCSCLSPGSASSLLVPSPASVHGSPLILLEPLFPKDYKWDE